MSKLSVNCRKSRNLVEKITAIAKTLNTAPALIAARKDIVPRIQG